ncbi:DUF2252 domain-containing protein [Mucilaginibacter sp. McL0603]|uniref:DUF2252 domain-containing protein n=1 Tax=Mucilaginibacter sp. McL0603 TaxID=3415670 RepID=UPI003CF4B001
MKKESSYELTKERPSVEQRIAKGKSLRNKFPRAKQGNYKPAPDRADPVAILEEQGKSRLPDLVPIRYARMLTSPFAFLRGAAAIMAADLAASAPTSGIVVQACGDMHVANFGIFASAERNLIFGINDFDETLPGPWEWDLKRLVASIVASGRFLGASENLCEKAVRAAVSSYRNRMKEFAYKGNMELWYTIITEKDILQTLTPANRKRMKKITDKARERTHMQVLGKMTDLVGDQYRLRVNAPFIVRETHTQLGRPIEEALDLVLKSYFTSLADDRKYLLQHYQITDVARKIVGVGSVGTRCWIVFLTGNSSNDPLFLQVKEAQRSVLEPFVNKSIYSNHGQRVVAGQRLIQGAPDIFLGWGEMDGFQFYIRQLRDMKGGVEFDPEKVKIQNLPQYSALCAWSLALAHAKSGDAAMITGYVGNSEELDNAMVQFSFAYADQTEKDHRALAAAARNGRIQVASAEG